MAGAYCAHESVIRLLLELIAFNVNSMHTLKGWTVLSLAVMNGNEYVVKTVAQISFVDTDSEDNYDQTPLVVGRHSRTYGSGAASSREWKCECGCWRYPLWWDTLSRAVENGHAMVVQLLLEDGRVDLNSRDAIYRRTPLSRAVGGGYENVVRLLLGQQGVEINTKDTDYNRTPLW
jgi:ankyrin repeat protein